MSTDGFTNDVASQLDFDGPADTLSPSEAWDSDDVRNNDGDDVVDPPDGWAEADKFGTTAYEQRVGETLEDRLAEEEPDPTVDGDLSDGDADDSFTYTDTPLERDDDGVLVVADPGIHRGQIDGSPEDGTSFFPVIE
ncbi:hypothetical protein FOS14_11130 [Skermania sp. ID1734]|uniref:hypothetical protein n=1 Tax=Skermania sp. ID1734 TaxID=2597516 RepID=UPI00117F3B26|nr:hypothetical protein [Skermania sp. ID1734]TSD99791.1 hypothetical protein FOS14_11130 [Skermania sp. ID1734]